MILAITATDFPTEKPSMPKPAKAEPVMTLQVEAEIAPHVLAWFARYRDHQIPETSQIDGVPSITFKGPVDVIDLVEGFVAGWVEHRRTSKK